MSVDREQDVEPLAEAGATLVIPEGFAASLTLGMHIFRLTGLSDSDAVAAIAELQLAEQQLDPKTRAC